MVGGAALLLYGQSKTMYDRNQMNNTLDVFRIFDIYDLGVFCLSVSLTCPRLTCDSSTFPYSDSINCFTAAILDLKRITKDCHSLGVRSIFLNSSERCGSHKRRDNAHIGNDIG